MDIIDHLAIKYQPEKVSKPRYLFWETNINDE